MDTLLRRLIELNDPIAREDIEYLAEELGLSIPTIMYIRDMPDSISEGKYIMNLDNQYRGGTHYVALVRTPNDALYFDSFGVEPPEELIKRLDGVPLWSSNDHIQDFESNMCGLFCLHFLLHVDDLEGYRRYLREFILNK